MLHLAGNRKSTETLSDIPSIGKLKAHPHSDTLPLTKPYPIVLFCFVFNSFGSLFFGDLLPSSQINTQRCIVTLMWLVSRQLFLNYPIYLLPLSFYLSLFLYTFSYFLLCVLLYSWAAGPWCPPSPFLIPKYFFSPFLLLYILSACQTHLSFFPALLLAIQLFIRPIKYFRQTK